jgi:hypothetical protein
MNGKGSKRRPAQVPGRELQRRWDQTFGEHKKTVDTDGRLGHHAQEVDQMTDQRSAEAPAEDLASIDAAIREQALALGALDIIRRDPPGAPVMVRCVCPGRLDLIAVGATVKEALQSLIAYPEHTQWRLELRNDQSGMRMFVPGLYVGREAVYAGYIDALHDPRRPASASVWMVPAAPVTEVDQMTNMPERAYSDEVREAVREEMSNLSGWVLPCEPVGHRCRDCPWDLFQDESREDPYSCMRPFSPDEWILAECFVALECGAL